ncbi:MULTISPECIES: hypothetical protein [unclassified Mesorhizobium]|uniref:hypothetical protein n=1 Tax=unclassified Mesorhizobium TaxID=325217 RepID=UPI00333AE0D6
MLLLTAAALLAVIGAASSQEATMSFFVTSVGSGKGADLGGLAGADVHCSSLAEAAGVTGKTWRAYLSTSDTDARDRIGKGPWFNAKGVKIADDVASLHSDANAITKQTALDEKGQMVNGRGDTPNRHDVLTGSKPDGTKIADQTCGDWTLSGAEGVAMMGHHDRTGLDDSAAAKSWNSSHASRGGCSQEALNGTGGDGLFYCFAVN